MASTALRGRLRPEVYIDDFDTQAYLDKYPDVARHDFWGSRPALHYQLHGKKEGRQFYSVSDRIEREKQDMVKELETDIAAGSTTQATITSRKKSRRRRGAVTVTTRKIDAPGTKDNVMPSQGDESIFLAKKRAAAEAMNRRGRASTILSTTPLQRM